MITAPSDYPGKKYYGIYCYEHQLVYWRTNGRLPGPHEVIHHKDGNKKNNEPTNLVMKTSSDHSRDHAKPPKPPVMIHCAWCNDLVAVRASRYYSNIRLLGQVDFYCGRSCAARHFGRGRSKK